MRRPYWLVVLFAWWTGSDAGEAGTPPIPKLSWPTELRARISSDFGERIRDGRREFHGGLDLGVGHLVSKGGKHTPAPVYAAESGKVIYRYTAATGRAYGGKGDAVIVQHTGFTTVYGHLDPSVRVGDRVTAGQQIGTVTRWPGNEHLHFGVHRGTVNLKDQGKVTRALRGIYPPATDPKVVGVVNPRAVLQTPKELAADVGKKVADAFKFPPSKKPVPVPAPVPGKPPPAPVGATEASLTLESIKVVKPAGLPARRWEDGLGGKGITFGTVGNQNSYVNVQKHPGFPNAAYTPDGVARVLCQIAWQRVGAVKVGKDALPGIHLAGAGGRTAVLFSHGGAVYMIASRGQKDVFWRVMRSVGAVAKK